MEQEIFIDRRIIVDSQGMALEDNIWLKRYRIRHKKMKKNIYIYILYMKRWNKKFLLIDEL